MHDQRKNTIIPPTLACDDVRVRAVLLDGLGTLVALEPPAPALAERLSREYGIELTVAQAEWAFGAEISYYRAHHHQGRDQASLAALRGRCGEVLHAALPPSVARAISPARLTDAMLGALRFTPHPDALATLPLLRARGIALVVVSNWDVSLASILAAIGLGELLDAVLTSAEVARPKPAPEIFRAALELVGVSAAEALHVGDSPAEDVAGARAAGVAPVLLCRTSPVGAPAGVPTISSLAELPALLN